MAEDKEYVIEDCIKNSTNKEFFEKAIEDKATWVFAYADDKIKANRDLILKCSKVDGQVLYYASKELRDDKEVVLAAVSNKSLITKYASKRLRADVDIAKAAINEAKNGHYLNDVLSYLSPEVLENEEIKQLIEA
jgi:hypothetical protein